jgi:hypothetical protein
MADVLKKGKFFERRRNCKMIYQSMKSLIARIRAGKVAGTDGFSLSQCVL